MYCAGGVVLIHPGQDTEKVDEVVETISPRHPIIQSCCNEHQFDGTLDCKA